MEFYLIRSDGSEKQVSGGCFGCLGRSDTYGATPQTKDTVRSFNDKSGHSTSGQGCSVYKDYGTQYLELRKGWLRSDGIGLHSQKTRLTMDYFVNRSPWRSAFANTLDEMYEDDIIRLHAQGVPSELVISAGFVLRVLDTPSAHLTYKALQSAAPDLPEFFRFMLSIVMPKLYSGGPEVRLGSVGHDGVIFPDATSLSAVLDPDTFLAADGRLCQYSIDEIHGYTMNIAQMWKGEGPKTTLRTVISNVVNSNIVNTTVQGVFGSFQARGIIDLKKFSHELYDLIQEKA